jgi:aryl-alcohol dehydrogenase-like predicted oxidoreductase
LHAETGYGNTTWSPLASGLLTGKYRDGIPDDSRGSLEGYDWLREQMSDQGAIERIERLRPIAERLDCSMAQLAIAWCAAHPMVSSVITGASRRSQVEENMGAVEVIPAITPEIKDEIERAIG